MFKDITTFLHTIEEKQIPPKQWRVQPEVILNGYKDKLIDRDTAIYILETLFYEADDTYARIKFRWTCIKNICEIHPKDKKLKSFLEEVFITEYWYPIRLKTLSYIHQYFPKLSTKLFNYIHEDTSFIEYGLRKWYNESKTFLKDLIKDPLVLFYLILQKEIKGFNEYLSIKNRKIMINSNELTWGTTKRFKRAQIIKEYTAEDFLKLEKRYFVYLRWDENRKGIIYADDPNKEYPLLCIHNIEDLYFCIAERIILGLFQAIKEMYSITQFKLQLIKTTVYYLTIDIPEINLYFRYRLNPYKSEKQELNKWRENYPSEKPICNHCLNLNFRNWCSFRRSYRGSTARICNEFRHYLGKDSGGNKVGK